MSQGNYAAAEMTMPDKNITRDPDIVPNQEEHRPDPMLQMTPGQVGIGSQAKEFNGRTGADQAPED
jgi:hypothetical protein